MRASDRKNNMKKANLLAESLYRLRNNEDFDYSGEETAYQDKKDYENASVEEFVGTPVSLNRKFVNVHQNEPDTQIQGVFSGIDRSEGTPLMVIEKDGKKVAHVMYDKNKDAFVEGMSSWSYVYSPMDAETSELLSRFSNLSATNVYENMGTDDNSIDGKFSNKNSIVNALYKILKNENVEGRYTDEHWAGISKLNDVFNKYNINYDLVDAKYEHNSDFKTQLPNSKVYTYMINVMDKNGKQHQLPLRVTCAFVGRTGTMADEIYELTYYFAV